MPKIICVHSYRPGTGKTMIAANIATLLASAGKHVCLIDADFHNPALHIMFKVDQEGLPQSFGDFLLGHCEIGQTVTDLTPNLQHLNLTGKIYLITAYSSNEVRRQVEVQGVHLDNLKEGVDHLMEDRKLDYVILDTYAGIDERTLPIVAIVDSLIVTMLLDKQDYQGTGVLIDVARRIGVPEIFLIVNSVPHNFNFAQVIEEVKSTYRCKQTFITPHDMALLQPDTYDVTGTAHFELPFSQAIKQIAALVIRE